jgi:hypothetical protein
MNGRSISCAGPGNCGTAIVITGSGSQISNSLGASGFESAITGGWAVGINCGLYSGTAVTGIRVENDYFSNSITAGIRDCAQVSHNVLDGHGHTWVGIETHGIRSSDFISFNNVTSYYTADIYAVNVGASLSIDHNTVVIQTLPSEGGIFLAQSPKTIVASNYVLGPANMWVAGLINQDNADPVTNFHNNWCDPTTSQCAWCISHDYCVDVLAPVAPWAP